MLALKMCFRCKATCGRQNPDLVYTDIRPQAPWRRTENQEVPWHTFPSLAGLAGFTVNMLSIDVMHAFHLGVARDLIGTTIRILCRGRFLYRSRTISTRLQECMTEATEWASSEGKCFTFRRLKKASLLWRSDRCPELKASAADASLFLAFLEYKLPRVRLPEPYRGLTSCVWAAHLFVSMLSGSDFFIGPEARQTLHTVGLAFLNTYLKLALIANERAELLFKLRPKFHVLVHLVSDLIATQGGRNPCLDSCFLEEDYVKWSLRKFRKMSKMTACLNLLRRCLVQQKCRLRGL